MTFPSDDVAGSARPLLWDARTRTLRAITPPPKVSKRVGPAEWIYLDADLRYCARTWFDASGAHETAHLDRLAEDRAEPPSGLVCSARLP